MNDLIKVIYKKPGEDFKVIPIPNDLASLQEMVGGYIKTVTICTDFAFIANEEGLLLGLEYNFDTCGIHFYGPVIIAGVKGEEFSDCPITVEDFKKYWIKEEK